MSRAAIVTVLVLGVGSSASAAVINIQQSVTGGTIKSFFATHFTPNPCHVTLTGPDGFFLKSSSSADCGWTLPPFLAGTVVDLPLAGLAGGSELFNGAAPQLLSAFVPTDWCCSPGLNPSQTSYGWRLDFDPFLAPDVLLNNTMFATIPVSGRILGIVNVGFSSPPAVDSYRIEFSGFFTGTAGITGPLSLEPVAGPYRIGHPVDLTIVPEPVPEPSTLLLTGVGFAYLARRRRRKWEGVDVSSVVVRNNC